MGKCYRCGYCCGGCLVPKDEDSNLDPAYLDSLALAFGRDYSARYAEDNAVRAGDRCQWLSVNPDGITTSCSAYERRSGVCRKHNADTDCLTGYMVMRQYGALAPGAGDYDKGTGCHG